MEARDRPQMLLVDNDSSFVEWVASIMSMCGCYCLAAASVAEAEPLLKHGNVGCAIISAELGTRALSFGQGAARHVTRPIPVAYVASSEVDEAMMLEAHYYGGTYLLQKPVAASQLLAWVGSMLLQDRQTAGFQRKIELLEQQASTDPLTGLFNRRLFFRRLDEERARAIRAKDPLSIVFLDIDHFKKINDTFGHQTGDEVLRQVARIIEGTLRKSDVVGRIGGEEFVILLPGTPAGPAMMIAERIRNRIADYEFSGAESPIRSTMSAGVYCCPDPGEKEPVAMVDLADKALYQAKQNGRNRVMQYGV